MTIYGANFYRVPVAMSLFAIMLGAQQEAAPGAEAESTAGVRNGWRFFEGRTGAGYSTMSAGDARLATPVGVASSTVGGLWVGNISSLSLTYTPELLVRTKDAGTTVLNHALAFGTTRKIGRWTLRSSLGADVRTQDSLLFVSAAFPATLDGLGGSLLTPPDPGYSPGVLSSSSTLLTSPARLLVWGDRNAAAALYLTQSYALSPRLSISFQEGGGRSQRVGWGGGDRPAQSVYLVPYSNMVSFGTELSYALSRQSSTGVTVTTARSFSVLQDARVTSALFYYSRRFGRDLLVRWYGGDSVVHVSRSATRFRGGNQFSGGTDIAWQKLSHLLMISARREASEGYGLGFASSTFASGGWRWNRPGSGWSLGTDFGWYQMSGFASTVVAWRARAAVTRSLSREWAVQTEFAWLSYSLPYVNTDYFEQGVRVSMLWTPAPVPRR